MDPWQLAIRLWLAANIIGAFLVAADKRRARRRRRRIPERTLLTWALLGGWPAMGVTMLAFRHKTRKRSFLIPFCLIAACWLTALGVVVTKVAV